MPDPALVFPLVFATVGAVIGSFLNVVIYRLPREDLAVTRPLRSFCPECERQLRWFENIPVLSWVLQGGRCRTCKAPIRARYVVVEVLTSFLFGWYTSRFFARAPVFDSLEHFLELFAGLYILAACIAVTFIDLEHRIIPDEITFPGMGLGLLASLAAPDLHGESWSCYRLIEGLGWERHLAAGASSLLGGLSGWLLVLFIGWTGSLLFRKEAMGFGDVKYMAMMGAFLGADGVLLVFLLGCVTGAVGGLIQRALTGDRYIAFGPYLSLGVVLVLLYRRDIVELLLHEWPAFVHRLLGIQ